MLDFIQTIGSLASNLLCFIIGLILMGCLIQITTNKKAIATAITACGFLVLVITSNPLVATGLIQSLESQYQPIAQRSLARPIVVLGAGGNALSNSSAPNTQLTAASLARLTEAARIQHMHKHPATVILMGGRIYGKTQASTKKNNTALLIGLAPHTLRFLPGAHDTRHEALMLKARLKHAPFILVTSAYHMPRALETFRLEGMSPIAAPTQYQIKPNTQLRYPWAPSSRALVLSDIAVHEWLAMAWLHATVGRTR